MPGMQRTIATPKIVTPIIQQMREFAREHPDIFIQHQLKVVDKIAGKLDFKYTWTQRQIARVIKAIVKAGLPLRLFVLKSRQVGSSTMIAARYFVHTWAIDNLEGLILSQAEERSEELLERVKGFYASLHPAWRLALARDWKAGLQYADTKGKLTVVSAKNMELARGGTKQRLLLSEAAFYKHFFDVMFEFSQPIAYAVGTEIIIETTGKGWESECHQFWKNGTKIRFENGRIVLIPGKNPFVTFFIPWHHDPTCTVQFENDKDKAIQVRIAIESEPRLLERAKYYKWSAGQLVYAYRQLKNQCYGLWEKYLRDYPCEEDEAWRWVGNSYFGQENVNRVKHKVAQYNENDKVVCYRFGLECAPGELFHSFSALERVKDVEEDGDECWIKVWKKPSKDGWYVVGADSAEGVEHGDFSSAFVVDMNTLEMAAEFHGKLRPDKFAKVIQSLCEIYNGALAAPEINMPGNVTLDNLRTEYFNIYRWYILDSNKWKQTDKLGWQTNGTTRPLMLQLVKILLEELANSRVFNEGLIKSPGLIKEMSTFQIDPETERPDPVSGAHDDRIFAYAICLIVARQETQGQNRDVFKSYHNEPEERAAAIREDFGTEDPADVIKRLSTGRYCEIWRNGNE